MVSPTLDDYPFTGHRATVAGGYRLHYLDEGPRAGRAVLLVHGNPSWSYLYRHLVPPLVGHGRRVIVPDHIGMGLSDQPEADRYPYRLARRIDDLESLWSGLGRPDFDLVVHDWGGPIGLGLAARHPDSVGRIVILNTAAFTGMRLPRRIAACRLPVVGDGLVRGANAFVLAAFWMATARRGGLPRPVRAGFGRPYSSWAARVAVAGFVRDIPTDPSHPSWPALREVEAALPRLAPKGAAIVWGGRDFCFDLRCLARWRTEWPGVPVHLEAEAGHYLLEDAPAARAAVVAALVGRGGERLPSAGV